VGAVRASADDNPQPLDFTHNVFNAPAPVAGAVFGTAQATTSGQAICTTPTQTAANVTTDCDTITAGPHNETSIAINPTNTKNIIGGANDYQLAPELGRASDRVDPVAGARVVRRRQDVVGVPDPVE